MNFRRLKYFVTIAECGNFHRAAEKLYVAQPALSRQMHELEGELGVQLLERLPRGVQPTNFGWVFLKDAKRILADVSELKEKASAAGGGENSLLRVGFDDSVAQNRIFALATQSMRKEFPGIHLQLSPGSETRLIEKLKSRDLDVGLAYDICGEFQRHSEISSYIVQRDDMVLALRKDHPLARKERLSLADLALEDIVMISKEKAPQVGYQYLMETCNKGGLNMRVIQEVPSIDALLSLVSVGVGISLVARHVRDSLPQEIVLRKVDDLNLILDLTLMWRKGSACMPTTSFIGIVKSLTHQDKAMMASL